MTKKNSSKSGFYDEFDSAMSIPSVGGFLDLVTAYKSLKLAMNKNVKGLADV
jgi:hypothetical protein